MGPPTVPIQAVRSRYSAPWLIFWSKSIQFQSIISAFPHYSAISGSHISKDSNSAVSHVNCFGQILRYSRTDCIYPVHFDLYEY